MRLLAHWVQVARSVQVRHSEAQGEHAETGYDVALKYPVVLQASQKVTVGIGFDWHDMHPRMIAEHALQVPFPKYNAAVQKKSLPLKTKLLLGVSQRRGFELQLAQ